MIENNLQYELTKGQARKFREALAKHAASERPSKIHPFVWEAEFQGMESQLDTLNEEIAEWEQKL